MSDSRIAELLGGLGSREPQPAWNSFLESYSGLISQVVRKFGRDDDESADSFLYVCEQLSRNQFHRLRRFNLDGPASFPTWLRSVVRNLCIDWHRQRFGRYRVFRSVTRLSDFDQGVFHLVFERALPLEECATELQGRFPNVSVEAVGTSLERLRNGLSPHQLWLVSSRKRWVESLSEDPDGKRIAPEIRDPSPDPEDQVAVQEELDQLHQAITKLPHSDRLILQLHYEQGLTLTQVARALSLKDENVAYRRIREALAKVRRLMGVALKVVEKAEVRSV